MNIFSRRPASVPSAEECLPGRAEALPEPGPHHVNGTKITPPFPEGMDTLVVAMGCFWGAERFYWDLPGVHTTAVGYAGGTTPNPTYEETCTGMTGHTEAVLIVFDPDQITVDELLKPFWENHDPTQYMGQGNDRGTQYRSAILTNSDAQMATAEAGRERYQESLTSAGYGEITTEIGPVGEFYYAEDYHQQYLSKHPGGDRNHGFCQIPYKSPVAAEGVG